MNTTTSKNTTEARSLQAVDREPASTEREKKEWWAVDGGGVKRVTGYSCAPMNPGYWWCPAVGSSMSEKHHLFEREEDALRKAVEEAEREAVKWTEIVAKLKARLPIIGVEP